MPDPISLARLLSNTVILFEPVAVASRLRPVLVRLNRELRRELAALGVTSGQAAILHDIAAKPGIGMGELAELQGVSSPAISGHVDRLEAALLVRRLRSDGDRRRVGLEVTPNGRRVLRSIRSRRTAWLASRLKELSAEELAAVDAAIEPLRRLLEAGA
jgi:DNA-binding MarR family transcriptional regulator